MTPVILTAAQDCERHRHATGEVAHCTCPIDVPCRGCGGEAVLVPCPHGRSCVCRHETAGWEVRP